MEEHVPDLRHYTFHATPHDDSLCSLLCGTGGRHHFIPFKN
jgi:hypothetical protein